MDTHDVLTDAARRPLDSARVVLDGISVETLHAMPLGRGNSIAWLVWHAARQADVQTATLRGGQQVWSSQGWAQRLGLADDAEDFGFGDTARDVARLRIEDPGELADYLAAVFEDLVGHVRSLSGTDLDDVVDEAWDPPVTRGVRIVSIIDDAVAHLGQAAYARGLVEDWRIGY